jgi:hypothetical protein
MSPDERRDLGPPGPRDDEGRGLHQEHPADVEEVVTKHLITNTAKDITRAARQCDSHAYVTGLHRRLRASRRMLSLDCGCVDQWPCRCTQPPLSDRMVDAGRDAATHLLALGHTPLLEIETLRALYRRGGDDRRLAEQLHTLTDRTVA